MAQANVQMDATFDHLYQCERLTELPKPRLPHYYYPGASTQGGHDGVLVAIRPEGREPWLGTFSFGHHAPNGSSGIFTMPNSRKLCVVAAGAGYIVNSDTPTTWESVQATPIIDVRSIRPQMLIVFATFTTLVAYGPAGLKWRTKRLTWQNLRITEVTDTVIKGEFWDIRREALAEFAVDLATGHHEGGLRES